MGPWIDRHWVEWSVVAGCLLGLYALALTGDLRAAGVGFVASAAFNAIAWRPGGFGHRVRAKAEAEEGQPLARPGCLVAMAIVLLVVVTAAGVGAIVLD